MDMERRGIENPDSNREERRRELREHLEYLATLKRPDPEERMLAIERHRRAWELVTRVSPAGTDDRKTVVELLDAVAKRLGILRKE